MVIDIINVYNRDVSKFSQIYNLYRSTRVSVQLVCGARSGSP